MGGPFNATYSMHNGTDAFKAFENLTLNRTDSQGTLQVTRTENNITLVCVKHSFFGPKVTDTSMQKLRDCFKFAVDSELDNIGNNLIAQSNLELDNVQESNLLDKIFKVKRAFDACIDNTGADRKHGEFTRADIKKIILNVKELKERLSVDTLLKVPIEALIHLSEGKYGNDGSADAEIYKMRISAFKDLTDVRSKVIDALGKTNVSVPIEALQKAVKGLTAIFLDTMEAAKTSEKEISNWNDKFKQLGINGLRIRRETVGVSAKPTFKLEISSNEDSVKSDCIKLLQNFTEIVDYIINDYNATDALKAQKVLDEFSKSIVENEVVEDKATGSKPDSNEVEEKNESNATETASNTIQTETKVMDTETKTNASGVTEKPNVQAEAPVADKKNRFATKEQKMEMLHRLASFAKGKWEGKDGGMGFLGMLEDGEIVKFLTHSGERKDFEKGLFNGLPEDQKEAINAATKKLRDTILELAKSVSDGTYESVLQFLGDGVKTNGFDPFVSRKMVASVVTFLAGEIEKAGEIENAGEIEKEDGMAFDWDAVIRAPSVDETTFDDVFPSNAAIKSWLEEQKNVENAWYDKNKDQSGVVPETKIKAHYFERLKDKTFTQQAARMMKRACALVRAADLGKVEKGDGSLKACTGNPFVLEGGTASEVVDKMLCQYAEGEVALQIFADGTHCGGGIDKAGQEESNIRDVAVELLGFLAGMGFTEAGLNPNGLDGEEHINYTIDKGSGGMKLSSAWGYLVNGMKRLTNQVTKGVTQKLKYLFTAMPSFHHDYSKDPNGSVDWLCKCRKYVAGQNLTSAQIKNVRKVVEEIFKKKTPASQRLMALSKKAAQYDWFSSVEQNQNNDRRPTQFSEMMMILGFSLFEEGAEIPFDVLKDSPEEVLNKLADLMEGGNYEDLLKKAQHNYETTIRQSVRTWIKMLHDQGVKCLVSGAMGCGFFKNPSPLLARIVAEEFVENGGDIKFVYARKSLDDRDAKYWQEAFENAWKKKQGVEVPDDSTQKSGPVDKPQSGTVPTGLKVTVKSDFTQDTLGSGGGLGTSEMYFEDGVSQNDPLWKQLRSLLDLEGAGITDVRSGYALVFNAFSEKSEYLKTASPKEKKSYLAFIRQAAHSLSNLPANRIKDNLKQDIDQLKGDDLTERVLMMINLVDEIMAKRAEVKSEEIPTNS